MNIFEPAWYCARTKAKHEHIAAANVRKRLGLEVFHPTLRFERVTFRGVVLQVREPLFPCYVFVHCAINECLDELRHITGIGSLVQFAGIIPMVPEPVIAELRAFFDAEETLVLEDYPRAGDVVTVATGPFRGMSAITLKTLPAKQRVQVLLEILGRPTHIELDLKSIVQQRRSIAERLPLLAITQ